MKIRIKSTENNMRLFFALPNGLALNRFTAPIIASHINAELEKRGSGRISTETVIELIDYLKRFKKTHPDWYLADVMTASGDIVEIKL
ncbi:MAG: hypothetical protein ACI4IW_01605 [Oscillospiraceae bacterium]